MVDPGWIGDSVGNLDKDTGRKPPREIGRPPTWLVLVGALLIGGATGAFYGASKVGSHVPIEMSCKLMAQAERNGMLDARQRREVTHAGVLATGLTPAVRASVERVHAGCRGIRL